MGFFIYILNKALFETNKVIKNDISSKIDNYSAIIENEINKYYLENSIENIIDEQYAIQFESLLNQSDFIIENIVSIVDTRNKSLIYERERIVNNPGVYLLKTEKIKGTINEFRKKIDEKLYKSSLTNLVGFTSNMLGNFESKCIESKLNQYLNETKVISSSPEFGEYNLINSSYKIGEVIFNLTKTIVNNYKSLVIKRILYKFDEYENKIDEALFIPDASQYLNDELNAIYKKQIK